MLKKLFALSGFKVALLITLFVFSLYMWTAFSPSGNFLTMMDKQWVDFIQKEREDQPHSSEVAIAVIDTLSVDKLGRWPWPRERIAELIDALNDYYHAKTIGFDSSNPGSGSTAGVAASVSVSPTLVSPIVLTPPMR